MNTAMVVRGGLAIVAMCTGCTHSHRVVNTGAGMLYAVTIQSGVRTFGHGYLPPGAVKGYSGSMQIVRTPAPVVSWKTTENGTPMAREVLLDTEPGAREVVFEIDGKSATGIVRSR